MSAASVFFLQALLVVGLPYLLWQVCRLRKLLPMVVVQVLAGIALGPTVFGKLNPEVWSMLFGPAQLSMLSGLQWLAVTLFCFLTGLHLREMNAGAQPRLVLAVSAGSILLPLVLGTGVGWWLGTVLPSAAGEQADVAWFAIAMGLCAAVTALPVLGAILGEMKLHGTRLGALALQCAALNDGVVWILLAAILIGHGQGQHGGNLAVMAGHALLYLAGFALLVRPTLAWLARRHAFDRDMLLVLALVVILASAFAAEQAGLHHVLGGFIAGMIWPRELAAQVRRHLEAATVSVLLPFFFLNAGLRAQITVAGTDVLLVFGVSLLVAVFAKIAGVAVTARWAGLEWRQAGALGCLLQAKGLVELVVLAILLDAGIIGSTAFSGLLLMAVTTTVLAGPLASLALRYGRRGDLPVTGVSVPR